MLTFLLVALVIAQPDPGCPEEFNQVWVDYVGICTDGGGEDIFGDEDCASWCIYLPDNTYTSGGHRNCDENPRIFCSTYMDHPTAAPSLIPTAGWVGTTDGQTETPWHGVQYFHVYGPCEAEQNCVRSSAYPTAYGDNEVCYVTMLESAGTVTLSSPFEIELGYDVLTVAGVVVNSPLDMPFSLSAGDVIHWITDTSRTYAGWQICIGDSGEATTTTTTTQKPMVCPEGYSASSLQNICTRNPNLPDFQLLYECDMWCTVSAFDNAYYLEGRTMCGEWEDIYEKKLTQCGARDVCVPRHRLLGENNTMCAETCVPMVNCTASLSLNYTDFGSCVSRGYPKHITDFTSWHEQCRESFVHSLWEMNETTLVEQKDCWIYITNPNVANAGERQGASSFILFLSFLMFLLSI